MDRDVAPCFVKVSLEDFDQGKMCGELLRHVYGPRPAADGWHGEVLRYPRPFGFCRRSCEPERAPTKGIDCSVPGGDFTSLGPADALDWFENSVEKACELSIRSRLRLGPGDAKDVMFFNRVVTWREDRMEYAADLGQDEQLIGEGDPTGAERMVTPGVKVHY